MNIQTLSKYYTSWNVNNKYNTLVGEKVTTHVNNTFTMHGQGEAIFVPSNISISISIKLSDANVEITHCPLLEDAI